MKSKLGNLSKATRDLPLVVAFQRIASSEGLDVGEQVIQAWPISISIQQSSSHEILNRRGKPLRHSFWPVLIQNLPAIQLFESGDVPGLEVLQVVVLSLEFGA